MNKEVKGYIQDIENIVDYMLLIDTTQFITQDDIDIKIKVLIKKFKKKVKKDINKLYKLETECY